MRESQALLIGFAFMAMFAIASPDSHAQTPIDRLVSDCSVIPQSACGGPDDEYLAGLEFDGVDVYTFPDGTTYTDREGQTPFYTFLDGSTYRALRLEGDPPVGPTPFDWQIGTSLPTLGRTDTDDMYDLLGYAHQMVWEKFGRDGGNGYGGTGVSASTLTYTDAGVYAEVSDVTFGINTNGCHARFSVYGIIVTCTGAAVADTVGHEYAHSIANTLSWDGGHFTGLVTADETGTIEEAWCDLMGEALERYVTGTNDWILGTGSNRLIRSMADPTSIPSPLNGLPSPDRTLSPNFSADLVDQGGVHLNAGVVAKAMYLMSEGGSFNGYEVEGIGLEKVLQIWYHALTEEFHSTETFIEAFEDVLTTTYRLYGDFEVEQVRKAMMATQMHIYPRNYQGYQTADFDDSGRVDGRDFLQWQRTFGNLDSDPHETDMRADRNADGIVDGGDLATWQEQFGRETPIFDPRTSAAVSVPEPSALILFLAGALFYLSRCVAMWDQHLASPGKQ